MLKKITIGLLVVQVILGVWAVMKFIKNRNAYEGEDEVVGI